MKQWFVISIAMFFSACKPQACPNPNDKSAAPTSTPQGSITMDKLVTLEDKVSYIVGYNMGKDFKVNFAAYETGVNDAQAKKQSLFPDDEVRKIMSEFQTQRMQKMMAERKAKGEEALKRGQEFLEKNKTQQGVVTLPSGLQYQILKEGTGPKPTINDTVVCNYKGTLIDGTEFDSSEKAGKPAEFAVSGVIKGWTEALQLMPQGSKWKIFVPANLAYGEMGAGPKIGPNETLIFEIELLEIKPATMPADAMTPPPADAMTPPPADAMTPPPADAMTPPPAVGIMIAPPMALPPPVITPMQ